MGPEDAVLERTASTEVTRSRPNSVSPHDAPLKVQWCAPKVVCLTLKELTVSYNSIPDCSSGNGRHSLITPSKQAWSA